MKKIKDIIKTMEKAKHAIDNMVQGEDANSEDAGRPIIFIPGIIGSELFSIDEALVDEEERKVGMIAREKEAQAKRLWLPLNYDKEELNRDLNIKNEAYGLQEGDLRYAKIFDRHTGPGASYAMLFNALIINFPKRPIYLFSYDWRKSNTVTSEKLACFINSVAGARGKVDIVAHSMGGLVSAHYMHEHPHRVEKYISFCTPYEGAPHAYNEMSSGNILGGVADIVLEKLFGIDQEVVEDYEGLVELYPTDKMLKAYPYQWVTDEKAFDDLASKKYKSYDDMLETLHRKAASASVSVKDVESRMKDYLGKTRFDRFTKNAKSYRRYKSFSGHVNLLKRDKTMFIVGEGMATQVSGCYRKDEDGSLVLKAMLTKEGDGQVPLYSACMGLRLEEMDADTRKRFKVMKGTHMGILMNIKALEMMCNFLKDR